MLRQLFCLFALGVILASVAVADDAARVKALIGQLKNADESERLKAVKELGKLKEVAKDAIPDLSKLAANDPDEDVRTVAKRALEAIRESVAQDSKDKIRLILDPLTKDLRSKDSAKRIAALDKLAELGTQAIDAGPAVVQFGMLSPSPSIVETATATLEKIDPQTHKFVVTLLFDGKEENKIQAIRSLEGMGRSGKTAMPGLKVYYAQAISNNAEFSRREAGVALQAMVRIAPDDPGVIESVLNVASMPPGAVTSGRVGRVSRLGVPGIRSPQTMRALAIYLLPEVKTTNPKRMAALIAALEDTTCRALAVTELGKLGADARSALPILTKLKLDSDKAVREAVTLAINQISD